MIVFGVVVGALLGALLGGWLAETGNPQETAKILGEIIDARCEDYR